MGFVDRGGGREAKGASLRRSKKNPGAAAARVKTAKVASGGPTESLPTPPPMHGNLPFVDCAVAVLSRQFDGDRESVIRRSHEEGGCMASLIWSAEVEKQETIVQTCALHGGVLYAIVGVHPDNIDRTNRRLQDTWNENIMRIAKSAECVALFTGINLTREVGTHFAQETEFKRMLESAVTLQLPIVLHLASDVQTVVRAVELVAETFGGSAEGLSEDITADVVEIDFPVPVLVHDIITTCRVDPRLAPLLSRAGFGAIVTGNVAAATPEDWPVATAIVKAFPIDRLLAATDSPWSTPQNLPDEYLRTIRSEPANYPFVMKAVVDAFESRAADDGVAKTPAVWESLTSDNAVAVVGAHAVVQQLKKNAVAVFGLDGVAHAAAAAAAAAAAPGVLSAATGSSVGAKKPSSTATEVVAQPPVDTDAPKASAAAKASAPTAKAPSASESAGAAPADNSRRRPVPNASPTAYYSCCKCRVKLFSQTDLVTHPAAAARGGGGAVAKKGGASLDAGGDCRSVLFVGLPDAHPSYDGGDDDDDAPRQETTAASSAATQLRITVLEDGDVKCGNCELKLGRCANDLRCPCGSVVGGRAARINATKTDLCDPNANLERLVAQSRAEAQTAELEAAQQEAADGESDDDRKQKKKRAKIVKENNVSNMGDFRNKSFVPRKGKRGGGGGDDDD